jgi:hypothetical protein
MFGELQTTDFLPEVNKGVKMGVANFLVHGSEGQMEQAKDTGFLLINRLDV